MKNELIEVDESPSQIAARLHAHFQKGCDFFQADNMALAKYELCRVALIYFAYHELIPESKVTFQRACEHLADICLREGNTAQYDHWMREAREDWL